MILQFFSLASFISSAKTPSSDEYENKKETRIGVTIEKQITDALEISLTPSFRLGDDFGFKKNLIDLDFGYDVNGWFKLGLGNRFVFEKSKLGGTEITYRLDADISKGFKFNKFTLKPRVRYSHYLNISDGNSETGAGRSAAPSENRFRYKLSLNYKHSSNAIFTPEIGAELYHILASNSFQAMRYNIGGSFKLSKNQEIDIDYLLDNGFADKVNKHIIELNYTIKF